MDLNPLQRTESWKDLPPVVVANILSYLRQNDRFNVSLICRNWARGFKSSLLWRSIQVIFDVGPPELFNNDNSFSNNIPLLANEKAIMFAERNGLFLQDLQLSLLPANPLQSSNLSKLAGKFFEKLTQQRCKLKTLRISGWFEEKSWSPSAIQTMIHSLSEFLKSQRHLENLQINNWSRNILPILEAVAEGSSGTIKHFKFTFEVNEYSGIHCKNEKYCEIYRNMPQLQYLELPFEGINTKIIKHLLQNSPHITTLMLRIDSYYQPMTNVGIPSKDWKEITRKYPQLVVKVEGELPWSLSRISLELPPNMPLVSLDLELTEKPEGIWKLPNVFEYLGKYFCKSLETFFYKDTGGKATENISSSLSIFLQQCSALKNLKININEQLPLSFIEDICKLQKSKKIDLTKVKIYYYSKVAEDEQRLLNIYQMYKDNLIKYDWKFIYERIH